MGEEPKTQQTPKPLKDRLPKERPQKVTKGADQTKVTRREGKVS